MAEIWMVISGKGGVGKSTVCTMLGAALARKGKKTLLVETDWGQRGLDIMNGVHQQVIYDLRDILDGRCPASKGILPSKLSDKLYLLPACPDRSYQPSPQGLAGLFDQLTREFDCLLIDCAAGISMTAEFCMDLADLALLVVTPDLLTVRVAASVADLLARKNLPARLIINKVPSRFQKTEAIPDLDMVIDLIGVQLIGVLPADPMVGELLCTMEDGHWQKMSSIKSAEAFRRIGDRLMGKYVPLAVQ